MERRWPSRLKKQKLNYRFHNLNSAEATAEYILQVLVDANRAKIESLLREGVSLQQEADKIKGAAE